MGGGEDKVVKQEATNKLPSWYEDAAKELLALGKRAASGGFVPYIGPDVAAMSPSTQAGIDGTNAMSAAFGMPTGAGGYMPPAQEFAGGVKGYSSFPGFEQSMEALKNKFPGMYDFLAGFNKINQGQFANPTQSTAFQERIDPRFRAAKNKVSGTGNKGPAFDMITLNGLGGRP